MIIQEGIKLGNKTVIKDYEGNVVDNVKWFCTKTKLAKLYATIISRDADRVIKSTIAVIGTGRILKNEDGEAYNEIVTFTCILRGCKAFNKETGEEIV